MSTGPSAALLDQLRNRVLSALHTGRRCPGDRLPSVRSVAQELDTDARTAMAMYRALAEEGLVEVRPRSGVYLVSNHSPSPDVPLETVRWVAAEVAAGAWRRRIPLPDLPEFLRDCLDATQLVCACVDEIGDDRIAICREIGSDFGMEVREVEPTGSGSVRVGAREMALETALGEADLVVVTSFHERSVRPLAEELGLPVVVSTLNPEAIREVQALDDDALCFVVVDERAGERLRESYGAEVSVVTVEALTEGSSAAGEADRLVFTPAAADATERLPDRAFVPQAPIISPETAEALTGWIVRLNLHARERR